MRNVDQNLARTYTYERSLVAGFQSLRLSALSHHVRPHNRKPTSMTPIVTMTLLASMATLFTPSAASLMVS